MLNKILGGLNKKTKNEDYKRISEDKINELNVNIENLKHENMEANNLLEALDKSQAVIQFKPDGTIITANENFLKTMGYDLSEIQNKNHSMFIDREYLQSDEYKKFWEALGRGEFQAAEYKRIGKAGKEVWIQAYYNPIFDPNGVPFKVVKFATDITDRVLARQEAERVSVLVDERLDKILQAVVSADEQTTSVAAASTQTM